MAQMLSSTFYCFSDIYHTMQPIYLSFNMISLAATKNNNLHMTEYPCTFQANNTCKISYPYFYLYQSGCYVHILFCSLPHIFIFNNQPLLRLSISLTRVRKRVCSCMNESATLTPIIVQLSFITLWSLKKIK